MVVGCTANVGSIIFFRLKLCILFARDCRRRRSATSDIKLNFNDFRYKFSYNVYILYYNISYIWG